MPLWINGYRFPDPIHISTFTAIPYTTFPTASVVTAVDTGELRTVGPAAWVTYVGSFAGGPNVAQPMGFAPGTMYFTLGAPAAVVAVPDTMLPGTPTISLGAAASTDYNGFIATKETNFVAAGTAVAGTDSTAVNNILVNVVRLKDSTTNEGIETPTGEEVFGLLQAWDDATVVDGSAVAANPNENLQISFVYYSEVPGPPPAPAITGYSLPAGTYYFAPSTNELIASMSFAALLGDTSPLPDFITRVYYVDSFAAAQLANYPQGAIVIAMDTDEERRAGATRWMYSGDDSVTLTGAAADYTITDDDGYKTIEVDCNGVQRTLVLPTAADNSGRIITVVKIDGGAFNVVIDGEGAETINGALNYILGAQWNTVTLQCNGTGWIVI
jgi:hypothetical protein